LEQFLLFIITFSFCENNIASQYWPTYMYCFSHPCGFITLTRNRYFFDIKAIVVAFVAYKFVHKTHDCVIKVN